MSKIYADSIASRAGGSPTFDSGVVVTGVATATSFSGNVTGNATGLTGSPDIVVGTITASGNVSVAGTITYNDVTNIDSVGLITARSGIEVTGGYSKLTGVVETVSAATTYTSNGALVLELDVKNSTTYRYSLLAGNTIGIVSFKNMPADVENGSTVTVLFTQQSAITAGTGNTTPATGIGTNCTIIPYVGEAAIAGISTRALVGSATTVTLSETASDVDFVSFFVHYNGGTNTDATSYKVYATKNGGFRQGTIGV